MAKSNKHVLFFLDGRYFQTAWTSNGMRRDTMVRCLEQSMRMPASRSIKMMELHPSGFTILCRHSQFSRFIIFRYEADECINGIKDLRPSIIQPRQPDQFDRAAKKLYMSRDEVLEVVKACGGKIENYVDNPLPEINIDVTGNFGPTPKRFDWKAAEVDKEIL